MQCKPGRESIYALLASGLLASCTSHSPRDVRMPAHAVVGVQQQQLTPEFWIARQANASRLVLDRNAIATQNTRLRQIDPSVHDLERMPSTLTAGDVRAWIEKLSARPDKDMFDAEGRKIEGAQFDALLNNVALETVPESQRTRFGLVVKRADLRTFPAPLRGYRLGRQPQHRSLPGKRACFPAHPSPSRTKAATATGGSS